VCERLETYLCDAQVAVVQKNFSALDADAVQVVDKRNSGFQLELPAKVERTHIEGASYLVKFDSLRLMIRDIVFCPPYDRRTAVRLVQPNLVSDQ
jgi:hypothetical protein